MPIGLLIRALVLASLLALIPLVFGSPGGFAPLRHGAPAEASPGRIATAAAP
ncbi:hypothetical protein JYK14_27370 [Siccirubricoccus sp. KC 17139]|uniref:Uncharacterized protein n=1 Tax=Siccirubricoccus soli TaxID=2899147 RepID=A0ABT1DD70_9PROT|nr:hypothetical protein [Siccirubricoccus soli]MCO6419854.1 hypothetical protein [Siccirubricoccus soli]MCP2685989.1 hypothetical protein [Siccirubricoccus soli]